MQKFKAVFFDVANTLLHKPSLYPSIHQVLMRHEIPVTVENILASHQFLSEVVVFPDKTSKEFYRQFNSHLVRSFGSVPTNELLDALFSACTYLPWEPFLDTHHLSSLGLPIGIISNWDRSLQQKLKCIRNVQFDWILGSAEQTLRKPEPDFFRKIFQITGLDSSEIIYVGDSMRLDIEPAQQLGINAILLDRDHRYPNATVPRIKDLGEIKKILES